LRPFGIGIAHAAIDPRLPIGETSFMTDEIDASAADEPGFAGFDPAPLPASTARRRPIACWRANTAPRISAI
jgi:hypothetical protein